MSGTNQLEMKLHEQADQLAHLKHEVAKLKEQLEELKQVWAKNVTFTEWNV